MTQAAGTTRGGRAADAGAPVVDGARLLGRLDELASVGGLPGGGVTRLAYSPQDVAARELVAGWLREAGLEPVVDAAGNLLATLPGLDPDLPFLATGSHLDTVVSAGPLDGAYGVVAAVEVVTALSHSGQRLRHPLRVVAFSNEEGARGTAGMVGSSTLAGLPVDSGELDDEGVLLGDRLRAVGGDPAALAAAAWCGTQLAGFIELHIEQGPVLEDAGRPIGVVDAITGRANLEIVVRGLPRHAGTTPMALRRDALVSAARLILQIEQVALRGEVRVATVGRLVAEPGVRNVVAGEARLSLDVRDTSPERLAAALRSIERAAAAEAERSGCTVEVLPGPAVPPAGTDPLLRGCLEDAAGALGLPTTQLLSGAGHDAQIIAEVGPVALCFVPSRDGVSHAADERTDPGDLVAGAQVLLAALLLADARLPAGTVG